MVRVQRIILLVVVSFYKAYLYIRYTTTESSNPYRFVNVAKSHNKIVYNKKCGNFIIINIFEANIA